MLPLIHFAKLNKPLPPLFQAPSQKRLEKISPPPPGGFIENLRTNERLLSVSEDIVHGTPVKTDTSYGLLSVGIKKGLYLIILVHEKFLQFDWLREVLFQLNLKYLQVKNYNPLQVVV